MTVSVQTPAKASTANGLTSVFPYDFRILDKSHLRVTGTLNGVTTTYTVDVDFTVDGVGNAGGGNVTFGVVPAAGAVILRKRAMPFVRDIDYQNDGDLLSTEFNSDQDAPVMLLQQVQETIGRGLSVPEHLVGFDAELPAPQALAPLVVNADGDGFEWGDTSLTGDLLLRPNLADALDADKGAGLVGFRDNSAPAFLKTVSDLLNGEPVNILRNITKSRWSGIQARTDTEDCAQSIMDLMDQVFVEGAKQVVLRVPIGTFTIHQPIVRTSGSVPFRLVGDDSRRAIIARGSDWAPGVGTGSLFNISDVNEHAIENLRLVGGAALYPTYANHAIACSNSNHVTYRGLHIEDWKNSGILVFHYPGSPTPASPQEQNNLIADCYLDGDGIANNGILFVDQFYSTIRNCVVRDLGKTGSPQYALQFKNRCWRSSIENCIAINARAGVAFGQDGGVGADQCMVSDVMVRDCVWGIYMGSASNSSVDNVNIDMADQGSHAIEMTNCVENALTNIKVTGQLVGSGQYSVKMTNASCDNLVQFSTLNIQDTIPEIVSCDAAALNNVVIVNKLKNTAALSYTDQGILDNAPIPGNALEIGGYETASAVTIAGGAISVKNPRAKIVRVDAEASAASDDLDTITGAGRGGQRLVLKSTANSRDVVVRHNGGGAGNIRLAGAANFTLANILDRIELQYEAGLSQWVEVGRSTNTP